MHAIPRVTRIGFAVLFLSTVVLVAKNLNEQREWESDDGRKITATVLEFDPDSETVKMRREDGLIFTIGIDQFAAGDSQKLKQALNRIKEESQEPEEPEKPEAKIPEEKELPDKFECDDVPMVKQKGNFCVPASAAMIAGFHGIDTDQDQIAFLSSAGSIGNQGTNPHDMVLAMQKLGFDGKPLYWNNADDFQKNILPSIREALVHQGPIYISFKSGVFGDSGHGCVIIGYDHRREYLIFHNPWGNVFRKDYEKVATEGRGIVIIQAPDPAPIASEAFIQNIQKIIPKFDGSIIQITSALKRNGKKHELVWCSRRDAREDKRFAEDTARDDGRKILDLAFHRNPAVLIPGNNKDGDTEKYLFVTRPPEGGARFLVREITETGWSEPELVTLGSLTRGWPTRLEGDNSEKIYWELPMIELHPKD